MKKTKVLLGLLMVCTFLFAFAACAFATDVTWNPNDKSNGVTLSNGNLSASGPNQDLTDSCVRATQGVTSGKWYWEIKMNNCSGTGEINVAIGSSTTPLNDFNLGCNDDYTYYDCGSIYHDIRGWGYGQMVDTYQTNDIISVCLNLDDNNGELYFMKNGVLKGTAFTDIKSVISGPVYPMVSLYYQTSSVTANFGATPFTYTVPIGYQPYGGGQSTISAPTNLTATPGSAQISLSWTAVTGATSYKIYRANTTGGPYTEVASGVTTTSYTDTGLTNGTQYYYVVTTIDANGESGYSNEANATPTTTETTNGRLIITMNHGDNKVYDLTSTEIAAFESWYEARANGSGSFTYTFNKAAASPYTSSHDKIVFGMINCWSVDTQ